VSTLRSASPLYLYRRDDNLGAGGYPQADHFGHAAQGIGAGQPAGDNIGQINDLGKQLQPILSDDCFICGAVFNLRVGSDIIQTMQHEPVPSHAIVGIGGHAAIAGGEGAGVGLIAVSPIVGLFRGFGAGGLESAVFAQPPHDAIVTQSSQMGGLSGDAVTVFDNDFSTINPNWLALHFTVTGDSRIGTRVIDLLNAPAGSSLFANFGR